MQHVYSASFDDATTTSQDNSVLKSENSKMCGCKVAGRNDAIKVADKLSKLLVVLGANRAAFARSRAKFNTGCVATFWRQLIVHNHVDHLVAYWHFGSHEFGQMIVDRTVICGVNRAAPAWF